MKVVILVADEEEYPGLIGPKCFTLTIGAVSLIEYLVRTLRLLGVTPANITIVTGRSGAWENEAKHDLLQRLGVLEICLETKRKRSFYSLTSASLPAEEGLLVLNGDRYFELDEIESLIEDKTRTAALVDKRNHVGINQQVVKIDDGKISAVDLEKVSQAVPWYSFHGAMFLSEEDSLLLAKLDEKYENLSYLEAVVNIAGLQVDAIYPHRNFNRSHEAGKPTLDLSGGSFAGLSRSIVVRKSADPTGLRKLKDEIIWLRNRAGSKTLNKFPKVLDFHIGEDEAWYTMPWYQYDNLRKKIITGKISLDEFDRSLRTVMDYLWENVYSHSMGSPEPDWIDKKHFNRFSERLNLISHIEPFSDIIKLKKLHIDDVEYENLSSLVRDVKYYSDKYDCFRPHKLVMIHGDLHFQNILVSDDHSDFILADPRGELDGSDIFYDLGKLWHSFNGKYDLIHTDIASVTKTSLESGAIGFSIDLGPSYLVDFYGRIGEKVSEILCSYPVSDVPDWYIKTKFNEFMHFSSLMYFHLFHDRIEERALALYLQGVKLGTELVYELRRQYD